MEIIDFLPKYQDEINKLQQDQWGEGTDTDDIVNNIENYFVKLVVDDGKLIGVIVWHYENKDICFLDLIIIKPEFQRKGLGTKLFKILIEDALAKDKQTIECEVIEAKGKINAKKLLENFGFVKQYSEKGYWGKTLPNFSCRECGCKPCTCTMHKYKKVLRPKFSEEELKKLRKEKIFLCICATGKTTLASIDNRFVDIDGEEARYKYGISEDSTYKDMARLWDEGKIVKDNSEDYIHSKLIEHLNNGKIILSATHRHIIKFLGEQKLSYVIIQYSPDEMEDFKQRMRNRGNSEEFIQAMLGHRAEAYANHKKDPNASLVLDIHAGEFLSDLMWQIFGKPQNKK